MCPSIRYAAVVLVVALGACGGHGANDVAAGAPDESGARAAHAAYVTAINSNDLAQFDKVIADDVVYIAPNSPPYVGKAAVMAFGRGYFDAYTTHWEKTSLDFHVVGDVAYETYGYKSVDTPREGAPVVGTPVVTDTGTGLNIYRRGSDGVWRVARDAWATDKAVSAN